MKQAIAPADGATPPIAEAENALHTRSAHWHGALRRFNAAEGAFSPAFNRRRHRMLIIGGGLVFLCSIPWTFYFAFMGRLMPTLIQAACVAAGAAVLWLARLRLLRVASLLFCLSGLFLVFAMALAVDVATPAVPRSTHLYFIPLTVAAFFLLQNEITPLRIGVPVLALLLFIGFSSLSGPLGFTPVMDDEGRRNAVPYVAAFTATAVYAALYVMLREAKEATALEQAFAVAIAADELEIHLQPQCSADGRVIGAEALMRWRHPERGYISPAEFIPMAERSGLIVPAGERILGEVCALLQRWSEIPALASLSIAVNISPAQLFSGDSARRLLDRVPEAVARRGVLKFELTESVFVQDIERVRECMAQIRERGIGLALDDFGTGFSSLNYLHQLPLDQLKVDQSFVALLPDDANAGLIARTIVQLGRDLGLEVVAEGTETAAQVQALREMGCEQFQGYLFSRPVPVADFETLARDVHDGRRSLIGS